MDIVLLRHVIGDKWYYVRFAKTYPVGQTQAAHLISLWFHYV